MSSIRTVTVVSLSCALALAGLAARHAAGQSVHSADGPSWLEFARRGMAVVWSEPSPFEHFRPVFGSWLWGLDLLGASTPSAWLLAGVALSCLAAGAAAWTFRALLPAPQALLAATVLFIHPARHEQIFWSSAQIDTLCLAISLACLGVVLRRPGDGAGGVPRSSFAGLMLLALLTALAVLTKEIALLLPVLIAVLPAGASRRERMTEAAASGAGAFCAVLAAGRVMGGAGRSRLILTHAGGLTVLQYPLRLLWPAAEGVRTPDPAYWSGWRALAPALVATAALILGVSLIWKHHGGRGWVRVGIFLIAASWLVWGVTPNDRGLGLGCAGAALLFAGGLGAVKTGRSAVPAMALLVVAGSWSLLWAGRERLWSESSRLDAQTAVALGNWRLEAEPSRLLVVVGRVMSFGAGTHLFNLRELDPCAMTVLGVAGAPPVAAPSVHREGGSGRLRVTAAPGSVLAWHCTPIAGSGVVEVECDATGFARRALVDPALLDGRLLPRSCGPLDVRRWDGESFVPIEPR